MGGWIAWVDAIFYSYQWGPQDLKEWNGSYKGGPQDLKIWNWQKKKSRMAIKQNHKDIFIKTDNNCKDYIVVDNLSFYKMWLVTYSIFQLQYHGSIPWVNEYHGWILQYHGQMPFTIPWVNSMGEWIPWVDFTIPRADAIYNTMGKFHGSMNNMGGWVPWVDAIFHSDHSSLLKKQWSPLRKVPSCKAFVEYEELLKIRVLCG